MNKNIGLIFATRNAIHPVLEAFSKYAPGTDVQIFVDEGLLSAVQEAKGVTAPILRRFASLLARAEESKVDGILFSCSVFSPSLETLKPLFVVPLMSVDSAMIAEAASRDGSVGIIATVEQAEKLSTAQLKEEALRQGTTVSIFSRAVPEAFTALPSDPDKHDKLIFEAAKQLSPNCDRFVLAQISMARAADMVESLKKPVLTSLESSINGIMRAVDER
jgi:hypothetical protein